MKFTKEELMDKLIEAEIDIDRLYERIYELEDKNNAMAKQLEEYEWEK
jgi:hypothetical protein